MSMFTVLIISQIISFGLGYPQTTTTISPSSQENMWGIQFSLPAAPSSCTTADTVHRSMTCRWTFSGNDDLNTFRITIPERLTLRYTVVILAQLNADPQSKTPTTTDYVKRLTNEQDITPFPTWVHRKTSEISQMVHLTIQIYRYHKIEQLRRFSVLQNNATSKNSTNTTALNSTNTTTPPPPTTTTPAPPTPPPTPAPTYTKPPTPAAEYWTVACEPLTTMVEPFTCPGMLDVTMPEGKCAVDAVAAFIDFCVNYVGGWPSSIGYNMPCPKDKGANGTYGIGLGCKYYTLDPLLTPAPPPTFWMPPPPPPTTTQSPTPSPSPSITPSPTPSFIVTKAATPSPTPSLDASTPTPSALYTVAPRPPPTLPSPTLPPISYVPMTLEPSDDRSVLYVEIVMDVPFSAWELHQPVLSQTIVKACGVTAACIRFDSLTNVGGNVSVWVKFDECNATYPMRGPWVTFLSQLKMNSPLLVKARILKFYTIVASVSPTPGAQSTLKDEAKSVSTPNTVPLVGVIVTFTIIFFIGSFALFSWYRKEMKKLDELSSSAAMEDGEGGGGTILTANSTTTAYHSVPTAPLCPLCETDFNTLFCVDCKLFLCSECSEQRHKRRNVKEHAPSGLLCVECGDVNTVTIFCGGCNGWLCPACDVYRHKNPVVRKDHGRRVVVVVRPEVEQENRACTVCGYFEFTDSEVHQSVCELCRGVLI